MFLRIAAATAAVATLLGAAPASWLDAKPLANWNVAGAPLPSRPGARDRDSAAGARCASSVRPATSPEDRALVARGWSLTGPYERYGSTVIVMGEASADGMCRPEGYQAFVFVNGTFAGTLAPKAMTARTDGSIAILNAYLYDATDFSVDFARYSEKDALCCPHATSNVVYHITTKTPPRVIPDSARTRANSS